MLSLALKVINSTLGMQDMSDLCVPREQKGHGWFHPHQTVNFFFWPDPCGGIPRHQPFSPGQRLNGAQDFQSIRWQFALRSLEGKALELLGHTAARAAPAAQKDGTKEEAQEIQGHDTWGQFFKEFNIFTRSH